MTKLPPPLKIAPSWRFPLINAPVEKLKLPKSPVTRPKLLSPLTAINSEPLRLNPALLPDKVPPLFVKSIELLANAASGKATTSRAIHKIRFIMTSSCDLEHAV